MKRNKIKSQLINAEVSWKRECMRWVERREGILSSFKEPVVEIKTSKRFNMVRTKVCTCTSTYIHLDNTSTPPFAEFGLTSAPHLCPHDLLCSQIIDKDETQFMANCPPAVTESMSRRRTRIQVFWIAPPAGSGCVTLKWVWVLWPFPFDINISIYLSMYNINTEIHCEPE